MRTGKTVRLMPATSWTESQPGFASRSPIRLPAQYWGGQCPIQRFSTWIFVPTPELPKDDRRVLGAGGKGIAYLPWIEV